MMTAPVDLLEGVEETLAAVCGRFRVILITKGDIVDQNSTIERSGLADCFEQVEIVPRKDARVYRTIFQRHGATGGRYIMCVLRQPWRAIKVWRALAESIIIICRQPISEHKMPLAQIYIGPGRSAQVKQDLIAKVTQAFADTLGPTRQPVWVVVNEVPLSNWGVDGKPLGPAGT
jgi:4-oxalocrotonate tautomerase family enzyme